MQNLNLLFYKTYYEKIEEYKTPHYDENGKKDKTEFDYDLRKRGGKNDQIIHTEFRPDDFTPCPIPDAQTFLMETTYPGMLIGTGYAHGSGLEGADSDINCGFSFDYVTGQPYLPGSSVKGILHSVFFRHPEAVMEYLADPPKNTDVQPITINAEQCRALEKSIFGSIYTLRANGSDADAKIFRDDGVDVFLNAVVKHGNAQGRLVGPDNITPHPSPTKNPIPVLILKILPKVVFEFRFVLKDSVIEIKDGENVPQTFKVTAEQKRVLFRRILELMGAGAKTNVGYGALKYVKDKKEAKTDSAVPKEDGVVDAVIKQISNSQLTVKIGDEMAIISKENTVGKYADLEVGTSVRAKILPEKKMGMICLTMKGVEQPEQPKQSEKTRKKKK